MSNLTMPGFSPAAEFISRSHGIIKRRQQDTITFSRKPATDAVWEVLERCNEPDWDGEGATAIDYETCIAVVSLIESLPRGYPSPTVLAEPDGQINLEWYTHPRRIVSASVSPEGVIYWAALIGSEELRGSCRFIGEFPSAIRQSVARISIP